MFLPVLLVRDFGVWGFVTFALPNCLGAAAMGWVLKSPGASAELVNRHAGAMRLFSVVTVLFHVFFLAWLASWDKLPFRPELVIGVAAGVSIVPVECLSACNNGAAIALSGPGRWTYVYGRMTPEDAAEIRQGAADYAASNDGIVPWRDRIAIFRKRSIARIPSIG